MGTNSCAPCLIRCNRLRWRWLAWVEWWIEFGNGLLAGYPVCCIAAYCRAVWRGTAPGSTAHRRWGDAALARYEYVPCPGCVRAGCVSRVAGDRWMLPMAWLYVTLED